MPRPLTPIIFSNLSQDEKIVFICKIDCESFEVINIPNIIEKNILNTIAKFREISLAVLLEKLDPIGKALNRIIDRETVLKIVQKYIQQSHIKKLYLKTEKDLETLNVPTIIREKNALLDNNEVDLLSWLSIWENYWEYFFSVSFSLYF